MKHSMKYLIAALALSILFSCQHRQPPMPPLPQRPDIRIQNIETVDQLMKNCLNRLDTDRPLIVASLVSVDDSTQSSTYGRMSAEIIANRLAQLGYQVKELKMNQNRIYIRKGQGEFVLSRELQNIAGQHDVQAVVVGTYALVNNGYKDSVCVCLKIVDPISNIIGCSTCNVLKSDHANWK